MKNFAGAVIVFFIALFAYTKLAGPIPFTITSVTTNKTDTFSVTGEGKVSVPPDIALVSAGVQAQGATVKIVQDQLNKNMNAVSAAVKAEGVDSKDIKTSGYNINPMYDYTAGSQRITGYQASSNLTIKVRAIDHANAVIDAATASGANQIGGITFDVDDKTAAQNQAREKAVADAKSKAENAARIAGFSLGKIINYSEDFGNAVRPIPMLAKADMAGGGGVPTQIETGTNEITVTVTLSYQIQ
ncbi:MAG: SIMPL domain-containing protein [Candidatus Gottesmanbacteria bacterium]|nr:SIMPL domain-containing protein [Candidatus Gottesmanbacteria bacterium]